MSPASQEARPAGSEASSQVEEIRREIRPQRLDELRQLYREDDATVGARAKILAAELRLRKLDHHLGSLLRTIARESGPFGWETFRPSIGAVGRSGAGGLEAEVEMAFSPENHECVHGPSTAVPVLALAQRLLAAGESLTSIERLTWARPLRHVVRLRLWNAESPAATGVLEEAAFSGCVATSHGRRFELAAVPIPERPLAIQRDFNALSLALVAGQRFLFGEGGDSLTMPLDDRALERSREALSRDLPLAAAVVLDLVPIAILNWKRGRPMVACGAQQVPLPGDGESPLPPGTRLELRYRADLSHRSRRSDLWIAYYEFRYPPRQSAWSRMAMAEADSVETLLRKLHS